MEARGDIARPKIQARLLLTSWCAIRRAQATKMASIAILRGRVKIGRSPTAKIVTCLIGNAVSRLIVGLQTASERQSCRNDAARGRSSIVSSRCKGRNPDGAGFRVCRGEGWSAETTLVTNCRGGHGSGRISLSRRMTAPTRERLSVSRAKGRVIVRGGQLVWSITVDIVSGNEHGTASGATTGILCRTA